MTCIVIYIYSLSSRQGMYYIYIIQYIAMYKYIFSFLLGIALAISTTAIAETFISKPDPKPISKIDPAVKLDLTTKGTDSEMLNTTLILLKIDELRNQFLNSKCAPYLKP